MNFTICILACLKLSLSQFADDSVKESSYYQQVIDPEINSKYDLNSFFLLMKYVENLQNNTQTKTPYSGQGTQINGFRKTEIIGLINFQE